MILRRLRFSILVAVLASCFIATGASRPAGTAAVAPAAADWTFEGCWTQYPSGPCRDVYIDAQGTYWICRACGTTGNPGPGKCSQTNSVALAHGS